MKDLRELERAEKQAYKELMEAMNKFQETKKEV